MSVADAAAGEIVALHRFFEEWLSGASDDTDHVFARFANALAPGFRIVGPDGVATERDALLAGLRAAHGSRGPGLRLWVEGVEAREVASDLVLATYEEWQEYDGHTTKRTSSVLLRVAPTAPGRFEWVHAHETWISMEGAD